MLPSAVATPTVEEPALSPHAAGLDRNRADEVHLDLEGRVMVTGRQRGMHGAGHGGVEERGGETAMDGPDRVVVVLARVGEEHRPAGLKLAWQHPHGGPDCRSRPPPPPPPAPPRTDGPPG